MISRPPPPPPVAPPPPPPTPRHFWACGLPLSVLPQPSFPCLSTQAAQNRRFPPGMRSSSIDAKLEHHQISMHFPGRIDKCLESITLPGLGTNAEESHRLRTAVCTTSPRRLTYTQLSHSPHLTRFTSADSHFVSYSGSDASQRSRPKSGRRGFRREDVRRELGNGVSAWRGFACHHAPARIFSRPFSSAARQRVTPIGVGRAAASGSPTTGSGWRQRSATAATLPPVIVIVVSSLR